jgi:hypothetical protein
MKKIFSLIQLAVLSAGSSAFAIVGGPFDNGDYSVLLERSGYYQSSFTFKNGSGYALWSPDNTQGALLQGQTVTPNLGAGALTGQSTGNANRSVIYYKGVTFFGSALGEVDVQSRLISGYCNANSEYSVSATTNQQQAGFFTQSNVQTFGSSTVVQSGRSYTANVNWQGKITATQPQLRFSGEGELSIISPNGRSALASLAYDAFSQLLSAISQSVSSTGNNLVVPVGIYANAQVAIAGALTGSPGTPATPASVTPAFSYTQATNAAGVPVDVNGDGIFNNDLVPSGYDAINTISTPFAAAIPGAPGLDTYLDGTGPDQSYKESENVKIKVRGYRRFF